MTISILLLGSCLKLLFGGVYKNLAADKRSAITFVFGALPEGAGTTNPQIVGIVGGIAIAVALGAGYRHYSNEYHTSQAIRESLVHREKEVTTALYESPITSVEGLVKVTKALATSY
jgi:hypothetical protein